MIFESIALENWNTVVIMVALFGLVCLVLIGFVIKAMSSSDRKNDEPKER